MGHINSLALMLRQLINEMVSLVGENRQKSLNRNRTHSFRPWPPAGGMHLIIAHAVQLRGTVEMAAQIINYGVRRSVQHAPRSAQRLTGALHCDFQVIYVRDSFRTVEGQLVRA